MAVEGNHLSPTVYTYLSAHSTPADDLLNELAAETLSAFPESADMQIGAVQGRFLTLLAQAMNARNAIELGTFTGYSSICIARGLTPDGRLLSCDNSEEWTSLARTYWKRANLTDRIELRIGDALDTLRSLPHGASFDLAFLDADKAGLPAYWEELLPRIRAGGVVLVDNTLFQTKVLDPNPASRTARAIRAFNDYALADDRVDLVLLPVGDGLTFAVKKP